MNQGFLNCGLTLEEGDEGMLRCVCVDKGVGREPVHPALYGVNQTLIQTNPELPKPNVLLQIYIYNTKSVGGLALHWCVNRLVV